VDSHLPQNREQAAPPATPPPLPHIICSKCGRFIEATSAFCPRCGKKQNDDDAWYYRPLWILIIAFVALGPFALPLVWKSNKMGNAMKLAITLVIGIYTVICGYYFYKILVFELQHINELNRMMRILK
jgi:uncharacterized paraquat-inducible protein A